MIAVAISDVALRWLERECGDSRDEWRLLAEKAETWLQRSRLGAQFWLAYVEQCAGTRSPRN